MIPLRNSQELKRLTLVFSALFALALAIVQPHRVHHLFEEIEPAHDHGGADSGHSDHSKTPANAPRTECVIQAVGQHCSAIPVELATLPFITAGVAIFHPVSSRWVYHFTSSPFSQRAPPANSSSFST
jgi:hypothetical protein